MSNVRDVLQTAVGSLNDFLGGLPDGNWQEIATHLAAPGQQQLLQQQQLVLQQQQQMQQQLQQALQPIAGMQQQLQEVRVTQQQMQVTLQQVQVTLQEVQVTQQQMQQDFACMKWNQINSAIRFHNRKSRDIISPLYKDREGGNSPVGALPPAHLHFPQNLSQAAALTADELNGLQEFYQVQFAGLRVSDRRLAFSAYISEPTEG